MLLYIFIILLILIILYLICIFINGYVLTYICNFLYSFETTQDDPYYDTDSIEWCNILKKNWKVVCDEYQEYVKNNSESIKRFKEIDPHQTFIDTTSIPWDIILLRSYNRDTELLNSFQKTKKLLPASCSFAMFSILRPGKVLEPHYGPYKGVLRYHLCIEAPQDNQECYIKVKDKKYHWSEGEHVMFDDTFLHSAQNLSSENRVILFLDIPRKFKNPFIDIMNRTFLNLAKYNKIIINMVKRANEIKLKKN